MINHRDCTKVSTYYVPYIYIDVLFCRRMLRPNERLVEYVTIYPRMAGKREIIANLHTRQVNSIHGALEITVKE